MQTQTQVTTTPPLSGTDLVTQINAALRSHGTFLAGSDDPAALALPYYLWADTGSGRLRRRNAAGTAWVDVGPLLSAPLTAAEVGDAAYRAIVGDMALGDISQVISNANGRAYRYQNGLQVCIREYASQPVSITTPYGSIFTNATDIASPFPAAFVAPPAVAVSTSAAGGGIPWAVTLGNSGSTAAIYRLANAVSYSGNLAWTHSAIGRWK